MRSQTAGIPLRSISGRDVGVFVGASMSDYQKILDRDTETSPMYQATGTSSNIISNRVSYAFNLKGPSITVDTACSSSLVALHLACQSLRAGESCEALVGGVFVLLSPDAMSGMSYLRYLRLETRFGRSLSDSSQDCFLKRVNATPMIAGEPDMVVEKVLPRWYLSHCKTR